ncbi:MAG TPA: acyl-CoA dehydrogenase family protein [Acidimicrobiales bacterium]|nr:acyl-CoA dehydrogenase family protein [Acidimicrobiales bacterium]
MRFAFTEQQLELRSAVRQVLERECTPADLRAIVDHRGASHDPADSRDAHGTGGRTAERWAVLSELGAPGLLIDEAHGGLELTDLELVGVLEEAGWAGLPEPLAETAALAAPLLAGAGGRAAEGTAAHAVMGRALPSMAAGDLVATVGGVDPSTGGPVTTTRPAPAATGGASTQGTVRTERVAGAGRAGLFLLAWDAPGMGWQLHAVEADAATVIETPSIDGTRDLGAVEWTPWPHTVIASGSAAAELVADLVDRTSVAYAAQLLGLADRMVTLAADYAKERQQFGKPIGSFQAVKHHLANARVKLEFARPATYRAADSLARQLPDRSAHASMAKALASDAADLAARVALQVHGAIGYTWECDLQLFMKRAWALSAAGGDAATHRALVLSAALDRLAG